MKAPCENCPYRLDAPRRYWDRSEFEGVLAAESAQFGKIFSCHKHAGLPEPERGMCAGWLLDQKKRGVPSIVLRLALSMDGSSMRAFEAVSARGLRLFRSIYTMCRANGVEAQEPAPWWKQPLRKPARRKAATR